MSLPVLQWSGAPSAKPGCMDLVVTTTLCDGSAYQDRRVIEVDFADPFSSVMAGYMREMAHRADRRARRAMQAQSTEPPGEARFIAAPPPSEYAVDRPEAAQSVASP